MIVAEDLACARGGRTVLSGVQLELQAGEVLGVLGANGAGKTSLLATLAGELPAAGGRLRFDDRPLAAMTPATLARRRAVLSQSAALAFDLDVDTVVEMGAYPFPELSPADLRTLASRALALADVTALRARRHGALSGGEQQRVHLARVLVQLLAVRAPGEYRALMLDEPTASLDPLHQALVLQAVHDLAHDEQVAALVVLHDVNLAALWCDRLLLLAQGRPVALGSPAAVLTPRNLGAVYGMGAQVMPHPMQADRLLVVFDRTAAVA